MTVKTPWARPEPQYPFTRLPCCWAVPIHNSVDHLVPVTWNPDLHWKECNRWLAEHRGELCSRDPAEMCDDCKFAVCDRHLCLCWMRQVTWSQGLPLRELQACLRRELASPADDQAAVVLGLQIAISRKELDGIDLSSLHPRGEVPERWRFGEVGVW